MTATLPRDIVAIAVRRPEEIRNLPIEEREQGLRSLADLVIRGEFPDEALPAALRLLTRCTDSALHFEDLCDAIRARSAFDDDPVGYAELADTVPVVGHLDRLAERLDGDIMAALRILLVGA